MGGPSTYILGLIALASCQAALAGTCGQNFTDPAGLIKSPGFPLSYENNLHCDWFISPNKTSVFYIRSLTFQTEEGVDKVTISVIRANAGSMYIEPVEFSGMNILVSVAYNIEAGDVVQVSFQSDATAVARGFRLSYTTPDDCPESYFQCADGQCVADRPCDGIADCNDQSDETEVSEDIVEGESLHATVPYQPTQLEIRVAACSDDFCESINLYGRTRNDLLAYESYAQCNIFDRGCDDGSLVNFNYPSGWTSFSAASWQFFVSIRDGSLTVGWNNASAVDATVPLTSLGGKRLLIYPLANTTWINRPTEDPSSLSTESSTDAPRSTSTLDPACTSTTTSPAPIVSTVTTPASTATTTTVTSSTPTPTTTPTTTTVTTPAPTSTTAPTTTPTPPASTSTPNTPASTPAATTAPTTPASASTPTTTPTTTVSTSTPTATTAPTTPVTTPAPTPAPTTTPTTTVTTAASTSTRTSTVTTTTSASINTSPGRSTAITTPQPAATTTTSPAGRSTTTQGASSPAWITSSTPSATPSDPTPIWTTTGRPSTPSSTTASPSFPTPPTPTPGWPPVPAPPACPLDFPLRYQYLLVPVKGQPQLYVICFAGWGQSMRCPQPLAFSYAQQKCVWSWNASFAAIANKA